VTDDASRGHSAGHIVSSRPRRAGFALALGAIVLGLALLIASILAPPPSGYGWRAALHTAAIQVSVLLVLGGGLAAAYERFLHRRLRDELVRLAGPRIVQALPPQQVLTEILSGIYGPNSANRDVVAAVLGGEGIQPHGADLTISAHSTIGFELEAIDARTYQLTTSARHSFRENIASDRFVIFATSHALLRDSITTGCRLPLFETWFVPDKSLFHDSVDAMLPSVRIAMDYTDHAGVTSSAPWSEVTVKDVTVDKWPDYLTFFRESTSSLPRQSVRDYLADLRIFECDLSGIADPEHDVRSIERLSLKATTLQRADDGYCFWQASFPCYVDRFTIDATGMHLDGESPYFFRVVPFALRSHITSASWEPADRLRDLDVRSWLLPGHGIALLWRPADRTPAPWPGP
jgi:hypothetical protein